MIVYRSDWCHTMNPEEAFSNTEETKRRKWSITSFYRRFA